MKTLKLYKNSVLKHFFIGNIVDSDIIRNFAAQKRNAMKELEDLEEIMRSYRNKLSAVGTTFHRGLYTKIDWDDRLIGIKGPRGSGKTTMLLQRIKENFEDKGQALYISLDSLWFASHNLMDLVDYHYTHGGTHLFIDEVHHLPYWQTLLKNVYDDFPTLHVVYTGSSMLRIDHSQGDLSRRQLVYHLPGLSFREYLEFEGIYKCEPPELEDLLKDHVKIAEEVCAKIKVLPEFEKYLKQGYYPFYKEVKKGYAMRLQQVVNQVIENDYPNIDEVSMSTIRKTKKMLMLLAEKVPQTPVMTELYAQLDTDRNQGLKMMLALERGGLLGLLSSEAKSFKGLARPDKIFLNNPNLMYALTSKPEIGTVRETFFFNQLSQTQTVTFPKKGDFAVNGKYLFEVGGKNKSFEQIKDIENSFLAVDGIEVGYHNRIPLWVFGMMY